MSRKPNLKAWLSEHLKYEKDGFLPTKDILEYYAICHKCAPVSPHILALVLPSVFQLAEPARKRVGKYPSRGFTNIAFRYVSNEESVKHTLTKYFEGTSDPEPCSFKRIREKYLPLVLSDQFERCLRGVFPSIDVVRDAKGNIESIVGICEKYVGLFED